MRFSIALGPLIYPIYGQGELPQAFCRHAVVKGCLYRSSAVKPLSWDIRLKIAVGAARGLAFLHTSDKKVIYRDFKASNILLDGNAKISDFDLAKLGPSGEELHVTTQVMGTYGYVAPEYVATGYLYGKSNLYGFCVVLLEMLTGLRALDSKCLRRAIFFKGSIDCCQLTLQCLESEPRKRPPMKEVVDILERIEAMKQKPKESQTISAHSTAHHHGHRPILHHHHHSWLHPSHHGIK
ncbi:unnamed protein product [Camellia sinensis]